MTWKRERPDVVVIGGGVIGCAIAYYLGKGGLKVILLERDGLWAGASGSNQGGVTISRTLPPFTELARESEEIYLGLSEELGHGFDLEEVRYLLCAVDVNEKNRHLLFETYKELREIGTECQLLDEDALRLWDMALGPAVQAAIEIPKGIYIVWPFKLVNAFAWAAEKLGVTILRSAEVRGIKVENNRIGPVMTNHGEFVSDYVVNAAGAWSGEIGTMVGLNIPVRPRRGQVLVMEPTALQPCRYIMNIDYLTAEHDQSEDFETSTTLMQHHNGNWTIGSTRELAGFNNRTTPDGMAVMARSAVKIFPGLNSKRIIRSYSGLRPFCYRDGKPILGEVDDVKGFVVATGHDGSGVKFAPVTGQLIAEEIMTGRVPELSIPYRYSRFQPQ